MSPIGATSRLPNTTNGKSKEKKKKGGLRWKRLLRRLTSLERD